MSTPSPSSPPDDPVFLHTRREAAVILVVWFACFVWTVGYSWLFGYEGSAESVPLVLGLPSWVLWGVAVPWVVAGAVSIVFAVVFMTDDDLGEESAGPSRGDEDGA